MSTASMSWQTIRAILGYISKWDEKQNPGTNGLNVLDNNIDSIVPRMSYINNREPAYVLLKM